MTHDQQHDLAPQHVPGADERTVTNRTMEVVVAGLFMALATVVIIDSLRVGIGWAFDGPEAGYFPFYIGLIMMLASAYTLVSNVITRAPNTGNFVDRSALKLVLQVLVPSAVYVGIIYLLGIYVASAIFIGFFMMWLGKFSWRVALPVAIGIPVILYVLFQKIFLILLPTGPVEDLLPSIGPLTKLFG